MLEMQMTMAHIFIPAIVLAYLLGAVPFAQVIAKLHGKDLRTIGSGNIGATNLSRACGRKWAYVCFALDVFKGLVPVAGVRLVAGAVADSPAELTAPSFFALWLAVGIAAILGHVFPIYLKFKGGKGVSTSLGVAFGLWPYFTIGAAIALLLWVAFVLTWRYVSLASICAACTFPVTLAVAIAIKPNWTLASLWPLAIAAMLIPILVIVLHRSNIKRLLAGTESKIRSKEK